MGMEIERKFLVRKDRWEAKGEGTRIAQGYLCTAPERTIRVRIKGNCGYLTVKGKNEGISRKEFEYEIPVTDAEELLQLCEPSIIEKVRYLEEIGGQAWEIDVFHGKNEGLMLAEIELRYENEAFLLPEWLGDEVSEDSRYYNSSLSRTPYTEWPAYPHSCGQDGRSKPQHHGT